MINTQNSEEVFDLIPLDEIEKVETILVPRDPTEEMDTANAKERSGRLASQKEQPFETKAMAAPGATKLTESHLVISTTAGGYNSGLYIH
jgi:hypothetical protein